MHAPYVGPLHVGVVVALGIVQSVPSFKELCKGACKSAKFRHVACLFAWLACRASSKQRAKAMAALQTLCPAALELGFTQDVQSAFWKPQAV